MTWLPDWVASHLGRSVRAVVVDERGALADLDWAAAKIRPTFIGTRDVANAAGLFWDAAADAQLVHRGQLELTRAVLSAKQRPMLGGQALGWDRRAPRSSVLVAVSLALWGVGCVRPARPRLTTTRREAIIL